MNVGIVAVPFLLAKLWSVIPRLFAWPPLRSPAQAIERLSIALLVGERGLRVRHRHHQHPVLVPLPLQLRRRALLRRDRLRRGARPARRDQAAGDAARLPRAAACSPRCAPTWRAPVPSRTSPAAWRRRLRPRRRSAAAACSRSSAARRWRCWWRPPAQSIGGPLRRLALLAPRGQPSSTTGQRLPGQQDRRHGAHHAGADRPGLAAGARRERGTRALPRAAAGAGAARARPADRLRRGLVDDATLDRRAPARPRRARRRAGRRRPACGIAAAARRAAPRHARPRPARRRARAARAAGQRRRPLARPRLPGADHRPRAARRAQHEVGREPDWMAS